MDIPPNRELACIGARKAPDSILEWMEKAGKMFAMAGYTVRSGNAPGSDQAWARGANSVDPTKVKLFLPWPSFEKRAIVAGNVVESYVPAWAIDTARSLHPAWENTSQGAQKLLGRNALIIKGSFRVFYYTPTPKTGGTAMALKMADRMGVVTWDVGTEESRIAIETSVMKVIQEKTKAMMKAVEKT